MTAWGDFLVECAKFPFPEMVENESVNTTRISPIVLGLLDPPWRARYAVRDEDLVPKLCQTLEDIVKDEHIVDVDEEQLLRFFGNHLQSWTLNSGREIVNSRWSTKNRNEYHSQVLLEQGVFTAADYCLQIYRRDYRLLISDEHVAQGQSAGKVDFMGSIDEESVILIEAKSPSVMKKVCDQLPVHGLELKWGPNQPFISKIFHEAALYLGLRKMEWLFLSCHNYWVVCRLVSRNDGTPFLAYSPNYSMRNSSEPFRAFLGAILSVKEKGKGHVQASVFNPHMDLDVIPEDVDDGPLPEHDIDDGSGEYRDHLRTNVSSRMDSPQTCSRMRTGGPGLMITSSSSHFPESFQVWVHLQPLPNNIFIPPLRAERANDPEERRLWLTCLIGSGSTGNVWKSRFDSSDCLFATKVIELLCRSNLEPQHQFYKELEAYLTLEISYQSGKLRNHITPHCYGAFKGDGIFALVLELCDDALNSWEELDVSERTQVYGLVRDLHKVGIIHGDLEPRNVVRVPGGFRLIDFSESSRHTCVEISDDMDESFSNQLPRYRCSELQMMRNELKASSW